MLFLEVIGFVSVVMTLFHQYLCHILWLFPNISKDQFKVVPYTSGKILSARLIFLFFWQCV
jgi:hypothetical protein